MISRLSKFGLFLVVILGYSCLGKRTATTEIDQVTSKTASLEEVSSGNYCGITDFQNLCIGTEEEWEKYWTLIHSQTIPVPKLPEINFGEKLLLACFMGSKNSGGFSVQVDEVKQLNGSLIVQVVHTSPGNNCFNSMAITQPYVIVQMARPKEAVCKFDIEEQKLDCK